MKIREGHMVYRTVGEIPSRIIDTPADAVAYMRDAIERNPMQESVWVILLNTKFMAICRTMVTLGTLDSSLISPREILKLAIQESAFGIILVHGHPSGDPTPSEADTSVTRSLRQACELMQIPLKDHVIIGEPEAGRPGYFSFREAGVL